MNQLLANMTVGMVNIHCPACGDAVAVDVKVMSIGTSGGSYLTIDFKRETVTHECIGART